MHILLFIAMAAELKSEYPNEKPEAVAGTPGAVVVADDPGAPSKEVSSRRQRISNIFTIIAAGAALVSDGYFNNLMTMSNVVLKKIYPVDYTPYVSTQVSNALVRGELV